MTSRWLLDEVIATGRSVTLRQINLAVLNDGHDAALAQRAKLKWSLRMGWVFAAATDEGGLGAFRELYEALGAVVHNGGGHIAESSVKEALTATSYSTALVDALDDSAWDDAVRAAHQRSQEALGGSGGSYIIAVDGKGFFGLVLTGLTARDAGVALLDAVVIAASISEFAVLQRYSPRPP